MRRRASTGYRAERMSASDFSAGLSRDSMECPQSADGDDAYSQQACEILRGRMGGAGEPHLTRCDNPCYAASAA